MGRSLTLPAPESAGAIDLGIRFSRVKGLTAAMSYGDAHCVAVASGNSSSGLRPSSSVRRRAILQEPGKRSYRRLGRPDETLTRVGSAVLLLRAASPPHGRCA
jgi:hypothetical protein